ncbi:MAG: DUF2075 domain-containing protein [Ruminococcaceae bacterium]|nr:DUF2075 domain-containing protein [Oscillospiraceae bacterium]
MSTRSYYSATIKDFLATHENYILAEMVKSHPFDLNDFTRDSWLSEIRILKRELHEFSDGHISLEFKIPRMGKRVDAVVSCRGILFLLEFKDGDTEYRNSTYKQVMDYALDLKNFHRGSRDKYIVPVAVPTEAPQSDISIQKYGDGVFYPIGINHTQIGDAIHAITQKCEQPEINYEVWENAEYMPTPTIVEAAQALYNNHNVTEITRSDAGAQNLNLTTFEIKRIVEFSKANKRKSIIFVTGVPGAGKTLVGLNLASEYHDNELEEHAVFLSGNLPLVTVLQEALARDKVKREKEERGMRISKDAALREVKTVIQIIHHYRDEYVGNDTCPSDRVAIFDESQRAWTKDEISSFMARKKGVKNFDYSEPEFLIQTMDRHDDWAVIVCLVGGGQEINKGEAGLPEWFDALQRSFPNWDAYAAPNLDDTEYLRGRTWDELTSGVNLTIVNGLHLATSMRSFRSEKVSLLIKQILDNDIEDAQQTFTEIRKQYPIYITRDLDTAKNWVKTVSRGNERYGLFASSNAARLKPRGIYYAKDRGSLSPENWFLNPEDDIRSSYFLEAVASEFETQGLELDYAIVAWDADLRIENGKWAHYQMSNRLTPPNWSRIRSENNIIYLTNAYRVLLTRARQGFVIYIPEGVDDDATRRREIYDPTFNYLRNIGIPEL